MEAKLKDLLPRRAFFDPLERRLVRISPNGEWLAFQAPIDGIFNLWLAPIDDLDAARPITMFSDRSIGPVVAWAFDNGHVLISRDEYGDENFCILSVDVHTGETRPVTPISGVKAYIQELSRNFPNDVLIAHNGRSKQYFDLYRMSLDTGVGVLVEQNDEFQGYITDGNFQVRLARRYSEDGEKEYLRKDETGAWRRYSLVPLEDSLTTWPVGYSDDGTELFWIDSRGRDKAVVIAEDTETRAVRLLAEDHQADIDSVLLDPRTRQPIAAASTFTRTKWTVLDPRFAPAFDALAAQLSGDIIFSGLSDDTERLVLLHIQDRRPPEFFCLDRKAGNAKRLFSAQPKLKSANLANMTPVVVKASDGLKLVCYLSRPLMTSGPSPMVLVVHGGPWMRDSWGLNPTHQWLANRGYAVLSVNFRGSTGFGKAFVNAANKEWGGKMQTDLIDAVDWAVSEGIADPNRIAIMGGSYGGYAALSGLTSTPDKFACAVDLVGISNLVTFLETIPEYWKTWKSVYKARLGDFTTEEGRFFLKERSPLNHIDRIRRPLLIVQGANDVRVKASESEQIVSAMQRHGIPVTYVLYPDEGHGIQRMENRRSYSAVVEAFLAQHLGGPCEPAGDDLVGSSHQFLAGREFIAGL
ncbi:S9 family peptidase [Rhizobium rhizogenes]|uniref:S9 family peptidase n=1 Tax=Rhizobium rhizogenes TaxID=359 RepID=UPI00226E3BF2|nr:S9 family peptidase [Rhizobium rhizogenes]